MGSTVWFGLLGPLDIRLDGVPVPLPSARTRALLAALLCQPNRVVSVDGLVDAVWGADPPDGAVTTLRSHVMRLRRCLGPEAGRLETVAPGYRIQLDPATELDTRIFVARYQAGQAAAAAGDWRAAARHTAEALALWRGQPLADVPSELLRLEEAAPWAELRVEAIELRARADISLGRPADAAAALRRLAADHPHREPAYALLMSALAAADRRAEALQVYRVLRTVLVRDLGMEPSPELRALHQRILAMDAAGATAVPRGDDPAAGEEPDERRALFVPWPTPHMLPRDIADFGGREEPVRRIVEAAAVSMACDADGDTGRDSDSAPDSGLATPRAAFAAVVDGMPGVGKTALAVHVAHRLAGRFPDGQLYADLHGTSPRPAQPGSVLATFLRLLGIAPADVPTSDGERAALYRSLLVGRRVLIVLDDVRDTGQLAPLVPAAPGCALVATTGDRRVGIAGSVRVSLSPLTFDASHALLGRIVGADRIAAEPEAAGEVLTACAGLPLAIRAVGRRIAARPTWRIADLADRFAAGAKRCETGGVLDELRFGDHDVRARFEASGLADAGSDAGNNSGSILTISLCLLSLWRGSELGFPVAAALLGRPAAEAEEILERLVDLNLLQSPRRGRYLLHDLVREYAAEKARSVLTEDQRRTAEAMWRLPRARSASSPELRDEGLSQPS